MDEKLSTIVLLTTKWSYPTPLLRYLREFLDYTHEDFVDIKSEIPIQLYPLLLVL